MASTYHEKLTLTRLVLTLAIVIPNFIGNVLVCWVVSRIKAFHTLINFLLVHLAITDVIVGVFALLQAIFEFIVKDKSNINVHICKLITNQHVVFMGVVSSYTTIVIVAILRYYGITKPLRSMAFRRPNKMFMFVPMIWIISFISLAPRFNADFSNSFGCTRIVAISKTTQISGGISIVVRGIILPVVTLSYTYTIIYKALKKRMKTVSSKNTRQSAALRSANLLGFVIVAFIFCTVPYHLYGFVISVLGFHHISSDEYLEMLLFCIFILGSTVNPYLYWFHCKRFRQMTYKILPRLHRIRHRIPIIPSSRKVNPVII